MTVTAGAERAESDRDVPNRRGADGQDPRASVLLHLLREMKLRGIGYAALQGAQEGLPDLDSDVDLALDEDPRKRLEPVLDELEREQVIDIVQRLHYEVPSGYYYIIRIRDAEENVYLHLDCLFDPRGVNRYFIPTTEFVRNRREAWYGFYVDRRVQALHLLVKRAIKGRADVIQAGLDWWDEENRNLAAKWIGEDAAKGLEQFLDEWRAGMAPDIARLRTRLIRSFRRYRMLAYITRKWRTLIREMGRALRPSGMFVVLIGPDGSGKSTVVQELQAGLGRAFRNTSRFHWRPKLLPKLGGHPTGAAAERETRPPKVAKYHGLVSGARLVYYWMDFVLGYWVKIYPRLARSTLVIGERYFIDSVVNPERYGFSTSRRWIRFLGRFVPAPHLTFLLKDDPQRIHARKPELTPAEIKAQVRRFTMEMRKWGLPITVDTSNGVAETKKVIVDAIVRKCSERKR